MPRSWTSLTVRLRGRDMENPTPFSVSEYNFLSHKVFHVKYPGYKPTVHEAPNGDGKVDAAKRYAHVALKYQHPHEDIQELLDGLFLRAHRMALKVAQELKVPERFLPRADFGALRVLDYPPGVGGHEHTDFDLFTLNLWRDLPDQVIADPHPPGVHIGELGELLGLGPATKHSVLPAPGRQRSMVYFAIPDHFAVLPWDADTEALTVGDWIQERIARSRYT